MTRYRVPVSQELADQASDWPLIPGLRLISIDGPWPKQPEMIICTFEDDWAPRRLSGRLVELSIRNTNGVLSVEGVTEIPYPGPLPAPAQAPWRPE